MKLQARNCRATLIVIVALLGLSLAGSGCDGDDGAAGASTGTLQGTVRNALTDEPLAGATISTSPSPSGDLTTDADGAYTLDLPIGFYTVTVSAENFTTEAADISIVAATSSTVDADLDPTAAVVIEASVSGDAAPGETVNVSVDVAVLDGSTVQSTTWTQSNSVDVVIADADSASTDVDLPDVLAYRDELIQVLKDPPLTEDELPENVELPEGEFPAGLPSRFGVVGVNPWALERAGEVTLTATVVTDSGSYTQDVHLEATLPFRTASGLRAVPTGIPVLLHGRDHVDEDDDGDNDVTGLPTTYDWSLDVPAGSATTLMDATSQSPYFTPDLVGQYTVTVTDTTQDPGDEVVTIEVEAGRWVGAITGQDEDGRPLADACTNCHADSTTEDLNDDGLIAPDKFTSWAQTGHAEIFTNNLNTSPYWGPQCFQCHGLGYDTGVDNDALDDTPDFDDFIAAGLIGNPSPDNWSTVISDFPGVAQKANVQCENCHGPQFGGSHPDSGNVRRTSLSADVCAQCHGEPLRHARFQQWQLSGHANYELSDAQGGRGSCSRCHSANGFLAWLPVLLDDDPETDPTDNVEVTWGPDETHPQTCALCHDPHAIGTTSGSDTNATVRISGNTPPLIAGFSVIGAGKGAICMTCHNSRRGLRNDDNFDETVAASDWSRAPHGGAQTDVIMGQNAYFVETGNRGSHSLVEDTCVNCHMRQTPPPDLLAYNLGGTNHTFAASTSICSSCHGDAFNANGVQEIFDALMTELKSLVEEAILEAMDTQITGGNTISLGGDPGDTVITDVAEIESISISEFHGRQALNVTLAADSSVVGPVTLRDVRIIDGGGGDVGELYSTMDDRVPRAGWNYNLANNDGSRGIHNPEFIQGLLTAAINEVNDVLGN